MSILDTFFIMFKSNAKDVKKDMAEAQKATDEFQKEITKSDQAVGNLGLTFSKVAVAGVTALASYATLEKLKSGITSAIDYNAAIEKTARLTGINARELSIWNSVIAQAGGNPQSREYLEFITGLNKKYAGLGVNDRIKFVTRDLMALSAAFRDLGESAGYALAQKLGIPDDVYLALKNGPEILQANINKQRELDRTTSDTTRSSFLLKQEWGNIETKFRSVFTQVTPAAQVFLTILNWTADALQAIVTLAGRVADVPFIQGLMKGLAWVGNIGGSAPPSSPPQTVDAGSGAPLGIRTNNPGNLRPGGRQATYASLQEGIAAEQENLRRYGRRGINTLRGVGSTWAPPNENDTAAYIGGLSSSTGFGPDEPLDMNNPATIARLANAINKQENGAAYGNLVGGNGQMSSVTIGTVNVHTQATDADGIAASMRQSLDQHFKNTIDSYDDAVAR